MSSNLVVRVENTLLNAGSQSLVVFDWPGGDGLANVEGLNLIGSASVDFGTFVDTYGQPLSMFGALALIVADGNFKFSLPPGRWTWGLSANGGALSLNKLSIYKV